MCSFVGKKLIQIVVTFMSYHITLIEHMTCFVMSSLLLRELSRDFLCLHDQGWIMVYPLGEGFHDKEADKIDCVSR